MPYAIYLRKSRVDLEAEAHGEGDTLARHRKTLLALAAAQQLNVTHIYEEVVSGDTIAARPQMQQLLADVDEGLWEGVLVMEVERLARGDTIDQGIVAQAFKVTDTQIITPLKSYDPNNEFDEEYFEFGLFMARREYKVINRRLQRGRLASVKEGKWVGNTPPYGYRRVKLAQDKGFWLEPDPETAPVVRNIFHWYVEGRSDGTVIHPMGLQAICTKLNQSGIPSPSRQTWSASTLRDLLQNPVYCGLIRWGWRKQQKTYHKATGTWQATRSRAAFGEYPVYQGLHEPLVTRECWDAAQAKFATHPSRPGPKQMAQKNPLAGLCYCSVCGRAMVRRPYKSIPPQLICAYPTCPTKGSYLSMVEDAVLEALENTLNELRLGADPVGAALPTGDRETLAMGLAAQEKELEQVQAQQRKLYDFLERGIYTEQVFLSRSATLEARRVDVQAQIDQLTQQLDTINRAERSRRELVPKIQHVLDTYHDCQSVQEKHALLKTILRRIEYAKTTGGRYQPSDMQITLFMHLL